MSVERLLVFVALFLVGCGGEGASFADASGRDVGADTSADAGRTGCIALPDAPLPEASACAGAAALSPRSVSPTGFRSQIHQDAAFDGSSIWVTFVGATEGEASGQVRVARLGCEGSLEGSFVANACPSGANSHSSIAVTDDKVFVTWAYDDRSGKVKTAYQIFDKRGTPQFSREQTLVTNRAGSDLPLQSLVWKPRAYALTTSGASSFGVVGVREAPGGSLWGYAQGVSSEGVATGASVDLTSTPGSSTETPRVATNGGEFLAVVPERDDAGNFGYVLASSLVAETQRFPTTGSGPGASEVAFVPGTSGKAVVTITTVGAQNTFDIVTLNATKGSLAKTDTLPHGREGTSPAIAFQGNGQGIMFWLSRTGGLRHDLYYTALDWSGDTLIRSPFVKVNTTFPVGPEVFQMRALSLGEGKYAVVFPQGNNPSYVTTLSIVDLGPSS